MVQKLDPQDLVSRSQFATSTSDMNLRRVLVPATLAARTCLGMAHGNSTLAAKYQPRSIFDIRRSRYPHAHLLKSGNERRAKGCSLARRNEKSTDEDEESKRDDCRDKRVQSGKLERYGYRWQRSLKYTFFRGRVYRVTYANEAARVQIRRRYLFQRCFELSSLSSPYFNRKMARCRRQEKRRVRTIVERWLKGIARLRQTTPTTVACAIPA